MINLLIFLGCGIGGICRYWVSLGAHAILGRQFPYGTLMVNIIGSFLMGLFFLVLLERFSGLSYQLRGLLLIGFLGGFTTFSSFSIETLNLLENGEWLKSLLNIILSVGLCLVSTWIGILLGRQIV